MRIDKLAYLWLQEIPEGFFALIGREKSDAEKYDFKSIELKELALRLDGVFVPFDDDYTYFVEVQFQRDEDFYWRLLAEAALYAKQFRVRKWRAVVIYPNRYAEQENLEGFEELLATPLIRRAYLNELPEISRLDDAIGVFKLVVEPKPKMAESARELLARAPDKLSFVQRVLSSAFSELTLKEILKMLNIREEIEEELKKTRVFQDLLREGEIIGFKRGIKEGLEEGREMGLKEGVKEGVKEGKLLAVPALREAGFSDEAIAEKLALSLDDVRNVPRKSNA